MKKIETYGEIKGGQLKIAKRQQFFEAISLIKDCRVRVIVEKLYKKRTTPQNAYYWAIIVTTWQEIIHTEWGENWNKEQTHEFLKANFNYDEIINEATGEILRKTKSTTELTTTEMELFNELCRNNAFEMFNVVIPLPNEQLEIQNIDKYQ